MKKTITTIALFGGLLTATQAATLIPFTTTDFSEVSTAGNTITIATDDAGGFGTNNFGTADNAAYTADFGTSLADLLRPNTNGGSSILTVTNDNITAETTFLVFYDLDLPSDSAQFLTGTTGTPVFVGNIETSTTSPVSSVNYDTATQTVTGTTTVGNPDANATIFDISGINTIQVEIATGGRQPNFAIFTDTAAVPEPSSTALLGLGGLALLARRKRA